ncbi:olfactory receptor 51G2-like [Carettochelys insculpta]|uniref:olfactory receptor 51G2-like n=1 Tax=Carettochelys insculpta TaxID=44489 RepID=UPI003EBCF3DD
MLPVNNSTFTHAVLLLTGMPGHKSDYLWIGIPLLLVYIILILGNSLILFIIKTDSNLHEPMYIFLSMLAVIDLGLSIATMPTILGVFLFNSREISINACFAQLFFIHFSQFTESTVLLFMAFDRFVAISNPLRYTSILTIPRTMKLGLVCVLRGFTIILPLPLLLKRYRYCQYNFLSHSYCLHQEVMKLACSDFTVSSIYGLSASLSTLGLDSILIFFSYVIILKTVLNLASRVDSVKALKTCGSHLCIVVLFYSPEISLSLIHRYMNSSSHLLQIILGYINMLVPPLMNPIVYSVQSTHLRGRLIRIFVK